MTPSWRKPVGMLAILLLIALWCVAIASLSGVIGRWPALAQLGFYLVTGIVWITPLKPLLRWMETGRWR
ncbi:DUF2842 domain-containing protein [Sphingomonas sp. BK580]|uniref:DUF2842 domain-containing protein n=1 Tax=Sphingomonas sp. BK580 TaxID=2586972 RepID=UPI001608819A|nr:DUF2842 domain-containing protein [Sphingomonas sp. BK580]MBB3693134.1 putative membrane channel-forming protein YqfA (hemolysin III family) [Sphingomonas sp. BK580]